MPGTPPVAAVETITTGRLSAPLIVELPCSLRLCVESVAFGPHGTFAELTARTSKPARFEVQASTEPPAAGGVFARIDSATFNLGDVTRWDGVLLNLKPNTIYHYVLRAFAPGGAEIAMKTGTFRTLMRRVDVTLEKVTVTDDSDYWSACDCTFWFQAHDQAPKGYGGVSVSTGSSVYPGPTFSIDNPPDTIVVRVEGQDDDADFYEFCSGGTGPTWTDGSNDCMDWSFESVRVDVTSSGLGEETVEVHHLAALSGPLKFDAYVRIRIMYV